MLIWKKGEKSIKKGLFVPLTKYTHYLIYIPMIVYLYVYQLMGVFCDGLKFGLVSKQHHPSPTTLCHISDEGLQKLQIIGLRLDWPGGSK